MSTRDASFDALLSGVIDDTGLFPPAKLALDPAIHRFAAGRKEAGAFLLGRFVIPSTRLAELGPYQKDLFLEGPPFRFSVLSRSGPDIEGILAGLDRDLGDIEGFLVRHEDRVIVDGLEFKLPAEIFDPQEKALLVEFFDRAAALVDEKSMGRLRLYFEGAIGPDWHRAIGDAVAALAEHTAHRRPSDNTCRACFKLRCSGLERAAVPPVEQLAFVVARCREAGVPFKATAGLHHPIRHIDHKLMVKVHGFLNLFGAAVLAHAREVPEDRLREIIADEDPQAFVFENGRFRWQDLTVSAQEVAEARRQLAHSFGCGSLDDLRADLTKLVLLES